MKKINWPLILIVVWLVCKLATDFFIGNQPLAFIPFGLVGLILLIFGILAAYAFYKKPLDSRRKLFSTSCILCALFLIVEGVIHFKNGNLYYWRSSHNVLFVFIWWWWLLRWRSNLNKEPNQLP